MTRREKISLIKSLMNGEKSIADLDERGYKISMWMQDENDMNFLKSFDGLKRISKADFEKEKLEKKAIHVTLQLDEKSN